MTPPTEKPFEPTPEQVEEAAFKIFATKYPDNTKEIWAIVSEDTREYWRKHARWHLAELSTLRAQLDAANQARENFGAAIEDNCRKIQEMVFERQQLWAERDALKAEVVRYKTTLETIAYTAQAEALTPAAMEAGR